MEFKPVLVWLVILCLSSVRAMEVVPADISTSHSFVITAFIPIIDVMLNRLSTRTGSGGGTVKSSLNRFLPHETVTIAFTMKMPQRQDDLHEIVP